MFLESLLTLVLYLSGVSGATQNSLLPELISQILPQECKRPGIVDVRVFVDDPVELDLCDNIQLLHERKADCSGAVILQHLFGNVSFGDRFRKSRLNIVHVQDLSTINVHRIGAYVRRIANYDWTAKYLFYLPNPLGNLQPTHFSPLAKDLTGQRLYNNLFLINPGLLLTFNLFSEQLTIHHTPQSAIRELFRNKLRQFHRYHLQDLVDVHMYPIHFIVYGQHTKRFNRESYFINMFVDWLNISMEERTEISDPVFNQQFEGRLQQNGIVATFGHVRGDFRRVFTHEMDGICAVVAPGKLSTIFDDFSDPFDAQTWWMWFVCSELTAITWTLVRLAQCYISRDDGNPPSFSLGWIIRELAGLHLTLVQYCVLSPPTPHRRVSKVERLLALCYLLGIFIIATVYVSCVTSNLSMVRFLRSLSTVQDLLEQQVAIVSGDGNLEVLQLCCPSLNLNQKPAEGSKSAIGLTCSYAKKAVQHSPTMYRLIQQPLVSHYVVYLLHRESLLQDVLEWYVMLSYQADLYRYWDHFIYETVPMPRNRTHLTAQVITFEDIVWLFVVLPGGAVAGIVVFLLEIVYHRRSRWWSSRKRTNAPAVAQTERVSWSY